MLFRSVRPVPTGTPGGPGPGPDHRPAATSLEGRILARLPAGGLDAETLVHEFGAGVPAALRRLSARGLAEVAHVVGVTESEVRRIASQALAALAHGLDDHTHGDTN